MSCQFQGLAFVSGWVELVAITVFDSFAGMVTGNFLYLGRAIVQPKESYQWSLYVCLILSNGVGVLTQLFLASKFKSYPITAVAIPCFIGLALPDFLAQTGLLCPNCFGFDFQVCLVAFSSGAQNSVGRHPNSFLSTHTVLATGAYQAVVSAIYESIAARDLSKMKNAGIPGLLIFATFMGGVWASVWIRYVGSFKWNFILPAGIQLVSLLVHDFVMKPIKN